ncbi:MAG: ferric reductase-like transmembrane domain-containing protein [Paenibacillaceae bacterium]
MTLTWLPWFSTWSVIKASGFTSLLLLFISICFGAFCYGKLLSPRYKMPLMIIHQGSGWLGLLTGMLHGMVLTIDKYEPFSLTSILIPFTAKIHPFANGLGTIALYLIFIVIVTSDAMKVIGKNLWRKIHLLTYPALVLSVAHGIVAGSDSTESWAISFYISLGIAFVLVCSIRIGYSWRSKLKMRYNRG